MIKNFYAVRKGRKSGVVVKTWTECEQLVKGFPGAIYKGFSLYQKEEAEKFAKSGNYGKSKQKRWKNEDEKNRMDAEKYPCLERKSYRDPFTGVYYKNRCVRRFGGTTIGINFKPHIGNSVPW